MHKIAALILACGIALVAGFDVPASACGVAAPAAFSPVNRSANSSPLPQAGKSSGNADADTPENDDSLGLTSEQKDKIKSIRQDSKEKVRDIQKDTTLTDDLKERKLKQIKKETRAQIWGVLTPDQQRQWAAKLRARREAKQSGGKSPD